jgi:hypothetical protein
LTASSSAPSRECSSTRCSAGIGAVCASAHERAESGAVVVVQRASSDLKLNPHLHVVFLDGVYVASAAPDGELVFRSLPHLSTSDVADALQIARARILRHLGRRGVLRVGDDALFSVDDELAERTPALAQLARAAVSGLAPAGPELRRRPVELTFEGRPGVIITAPLSVREHGFSLHAATRAGAADAKGREALLRYVLRPPVATERVVRGHGICRSRYQAVATTDRPPTAFGRVKRQSSLYLAPPGGGRRSPRRGQVWRSSAKLENDTYTDGGRGQ